MFPYPKDTSSCPLAPQDTVAAILTELFHGMEASIEFGCLSEIASGAKSEFLLMALVSCFV